MKGGKAHGLATLRRIGMDIPATLVISKELIKDLSILLKELSNRHLYSVRSSAIGEDGASQSFAGQVETFPNAYGKSDLFEVITKYFQSSESDNVASYTKLANEEINSPMFVIVQEIVDAAFSGVLFTADPLTGRRDRMSITYKEGFGLKLTTSHETGTNITFFKHEKKLPQVSHFSRNLLRQIIEEAKFIENKYGKPANLEWAIDKNGKLWWLQLGPVTGLHPVHLNELDHSPAYEEPLYTHINIGELMSGPVTPLTLSTVGKAIDLGLQKFYISAGVLQKKSDDFVFLHSYYNHLFFDLNRMYEISKYNLFMKKENIDISILGQVVEGVKIERTVSVLKGLRNFLSIYYYIKQAPKAWQRLRIIYKHFKLKQPDNILDCFDLIDGSLPILMRAYDLHCVTSSQSDSLYTVILNFFSKGKIPSRSDQEKVAAMFYNISNIESANVLNSLNKISKILAAFPEVEQKFLNKNDKLALEFISKTGPDEVVDEWQELMSRHGHRCICEAEMRELEWAIEPTHLIVSLRRKTILILEGHQLKDSDQPAQLFESAIYDLDFIQRNVIKWMLPKARKAVARREHTKAWAIGVQHQFKLAYRHLARLMVKEDVLNDEDQIYFLKHEEIGEMIHSGKHGFWKTVAEERRRQFPELKKMVFPDVVFGIPVPQESIPFSKNESSFDIPVNQ